MPIVAPKRIRGNEAIKPKARFDQPGHAPIGVALMDSIAPARRRKTHVARVNPQHVEKTAP
jgi:hypothetical protein